MKTLAAAIVVLLSIISLFTGTAHATPIYYDEAVDGDLVLGSRVGTLGLGVNTVLGSGAVFYSGERIATADVDSGVFALTHGMFIESISGTISDIYAVGPASLDTRSTFVDSPSGLKIYEVEMLSGFEQVNLLPYFQKGDYQFFTGGGGSSHEPGSELHWKWRVEITTVPEPGTLWLLGVGLLGALVSRRRDRFNKLQQPT